MTLPEQSDRAVKQTREFLVRLSSPFVEGGIKGIRREVRAEALRLLRHYPYVWSDENCGNGDMSGATVAWIPVSERLPAGDVRVLVLVNGVADIACLNWQYGWMYEDYGCLEPTHWMNLPEPAEEW